MPRWGPRLDWEHLQNWIPGVLGAFAAILLVVVAANFPTRTNSRRPTASLPIASTPMATAPNAAAPTASANRLAAEMALDCSVTSRHWRPPARQRLFAS